MFPYLHIGATYYFLLHFKPASSLVPAQRLFLSCHTYPVSSLIFLRSLLWEHDGLAAFLMDDALAGVRGCSVGGLWPGSEGEERPPLSEVREYEQPAGVKRHRLISNC